MLYSRLPAFVLAFHGCDRTTAHRIVGGPLHLRKSRNEYDWLGNGIYFWKNDPVRARQWAVGKAKREELKGKIFNPAVVGTVIDLGNCLNLLDASSNRLLSWGYRFLGSSQASLGHPMPVNKDLRQEGDLLLRHLDCAVVNALHDLMKQQGEQPFDTVRAAFIEGPPAYPGGTFRKKNHIQICVRNRKSIKGYIHALP